MTILLQQVLRDDVQLTDEKKQEEGALNIDPSLSTNMVATFHITRDNQDSETEETFPDVAIESPSGEEIGMNSEQCYIDETLGIVQYRFQKAKVDNHETANIDSISNKYSK